MASQEAIEIMDGRAALLDECEQSGMSAEQSFLALIAAATALGIALGYDKALMLEDLSTCIDATAGDMKRNRVVQ